MPGATCVEGSQGINPAKRSFRRARPVSGASEPSRSGRAVQDGELSFQRARNSLGARETGLGAGKLDFGPGEVNLAPGNSIFRWETRFRPREAHRGGRKLSAALSPPNSSPNSSPCTGGGPAYTSRRPPSRTWAFG